MPASEEIPRRRLCARSRSRSLSSAPISRLAKCDRDAVSFVLGQQRPEANLQARIAGKVAQWCPAEAPFHPKSPPPKKKKKNSRRRRRKRICSRKFLTKSLGLGPWAEVGSWSCCPVPARAQARRKGKRPSWTRPGVFCPCWGCVPSRNRTDAPNITLGQVGFGGCRVEVPNLRRGTGEAGNGWPALGLRFSSLGLASVWNHRLRFATSSFVLGLDGVSPVSAALLEPPRPCRFKESAFDTELQGFQGWPPVCALPDNSKKEFLPLASA